MKKQSILSFVKLLTVLSTLMPLSAMAQFDIESADALVQETERIKEQYVKGQIPREDFDTNFNDLREQMAGVNAERGISLAYIKVMSVGDFRQHYSGLDKVVRKLFWTSILERVDISGDTLIPEFTKI